MAMTTSLLCIDQGAAMKHGFARPQQCAIGPRVPMCGSDDGSRLCSTATGASAPWHHTAWPSRGSQRRARSLHLRRGWFCSSAAALRCIFLCQCAQADNGSRLCSTATGASAPWRPTIGSSTRSQRRARLLHLRHFEFRATAREQVGFLI